jgi:hypothetical protein
VTALKFEPTEEALGLALQKAIVEALGEQGRASLVDRAVKLLVEVKAPEYGRGPARSALQEIFDREVVAFARKLVEEQIANDGPFKERLRELIVSSFEKMLSLDWGPREKIIADLASSFAQALGRA